ncbi:MAG TPA: putative baseplate assembly protein, partial [Burkholderiales bacterium]
IDLEVELANTHLLPGGVWPSSDLEIAWECWNGSAWQKVGTSTAPSWLSLLEVDPQPVLQTDDAGVPSALVQGTAQPKSVVSSRLFPNEDQPRLLRVGADGRFADRRDAREPLAVLRFDTTFQGRKGVAWVVIESSTPGVTLAIDAPASPVNDDTLRMKATAQGADAGRIDRIRVLNGTNNEEAEERAGSAAFRLPLAEGRNELLVEAFAGAERMAASAFTASRLGSAPAFEPAGFSDGTCALTQSGVLSLRLPDATARKAVNGQENFWLRARLARGNYGKEASYALKDPVKAEEGFTLVPASFRPPVVAALRVGYEISPRRYPEACLAYNELAFEDCTPAAGPAHGAFAPFAATQAQRPGLYLGFLLPADRPGFPPNSPITLYGGMAAPRYGERAVPLSPETSVRGGATASSASHRFVITNPSAQPETFAVSLLGQRWPATGGGSLTVQPHASREFTVEVEIPAGAPTGESDRGFVRLSAPGLGEVLHAASFATAAGARAVPQPPAVDWHYWDGKQWAKLAVQDGSEAFTRSGLVEFLPPPGFARRRLFGREAYWLRAEWTKGDYALPPRLWRLLPNTTLAQQTTTFLNEVLGSSNGVEAQRFRSTRTPVLAGQVLEVREPEPPAAQEQAVLEEEEGEDAIRIVRDAAGRPREIWVRWHEVTDFYGSGPRDRHYVIDHLSGEVVFGDGINGRVPPRGSGNLRLARYRTGGGRAGNRAAGAVAQLKTAVPYVEKATNPEPAAGGAEAETTQALLERMPRTLRHRDRAVTVEDYGDLARLASPEVARALCVPLRDLAADPLGAAPQPGAVSVVVVPATSEVKPLPTLELLTRAQDFLEQRAAATAAVTVVGPQYIRVDVSAEVAVASPEGASGVERAVHERLASFLHPLTGGLEGSGWDFGRAPHRSDFFALIESVPGVDHVRYLQIAETEDQPGVRETGRFLVFSGEHRIALVFEER